MEEAKQPCPKRRFRARLFAGVGLLLLAVYSLLWGAASLWLHGVQRQIASTGLALTAADVIPVPPPDEENPAVTLEKAYALLRPSPDDGPARRNLGTRQEPAGRQGGRRRTGQLSAGHLEQPRVKQAIALMLTAGSFDAHVPKLDYVGPNTQLPSPGTNSGLLLLAFGGGPSVGQGRTNASKPGILFPLHFALRRAWISSHLRSASLSA